MLGAQVGRERRKSRLFVPTRPPLIGANEKERRAKDEEARAQVSVVMLNCFKLATLRAIVGYRNQLARLLLLS